VYQINFVFLLKDLDASYYRKGSGSYPTLAKSAKSNQCVII